MSNIQKSILASFSFLFIGFGFFILFSKVITVYSKLPTKETISKHLKEKSYHKYVEVLDRKEKSLGKLTEISRLYTPLEKHPRNLVTKILYAEDPDFFQHYGATFKSLLQSFFKKTETYGNLGITQKVVLFYFQKEKTFSFIENILLSFWLERIYNKEKILELYLNSIETTHRSKGLASASKEIFSKDLEELDFSESLFLASKRLGDSEESFYHKRDLILERLLEQGKIKQNDYEYWKRRKLYTLYQNTPQAPLMELVKEELEKLGFSLKDQDKLVIHSTFDQKYLNTLETKTPYLLLDRFSGAIRGLQQQTSLSKVKFPIGPSLVPIYLALALEHGSQLSLPVSYNPFEQEKENPKDPSLYEALMNCDYSLTQKALSFLEPERVQDFTSSISLKNESMQENLFLDQKEMYVLNHIAQIYGLVFNKGRLLKPHVIEKITDLKREVILYKRNIPQDKALLSPESSFILEKAIQGKPSSVAFFPEDYSSYVASRPTDSTAWFMGSRGKLLTVMAVERKSNSTESSLWETTLEEGTRLLDRIPLVVEDQYTPTLSKKISFGRSNLKDYPDRILPFRLGQEPL